MPLVHFASKEISFKVAYVGPRGAGGRTNLAALLGRFGVVERSGQEVPVTEDGLHTVELAVTGLEVRGMQPRLCLYAACDALDPRESIPRLTRGADGLVFVADASRPASNMEAAELLVMHRDPDVPLVVQCNKRDIPGARTCAEVVASLAMLSPVGAHEAIALAGVGVFETARAIAKAVVQRQLDRG